MSTVTQILDSIAEEAARTDRTDGQLLDLFVRLRDEDAFATVVRRHGPMVLAVCRRVLRNAADADDAFQAAFLVLARKAATISTRHLLAQWLYGVAYNTARKLRQSNTRRTVREHPLTEGVEPHATAPEPRDELLRILDEELNQLPERYRAVIVLCDLEGLTRREAARMLSCPEGTVGGRLSRARALLAERLTRRGVTAAAGALVAVLAERAAFAVPLTGVLRAVGVDDLARAAAQGLISARVAHTTEGVLKGMFATKLRTIAAAVLCCGLALACGFGAIHFANAQPQPDPATDPFAGGKTDPAPKQPGTKFTLSDTERKHSLIPLKKLQAKPTAEKLLTLLPEAVTVAAVRDENALIVYATAKGTDDVRLVLRTLGEEVPKDDPKPAPPKVNEPKAKTFAFRMKNAPWADVLDWYSKESGLTLITTVRPTGTVTFYPPAGKEFTLAEITDLLNEAMAQQKFILIRRHMTFFIHPADEKIDPTLVPRIELSELPKRGKTEIVQVILPIKGMVVADAQEELKRLLTPFGSMVPLGRNSLLLTDTVGNINRILGLGAVDDTSDSLDRVLEYRRAQEVAEMLKTLLTDKDTAVTITGPPTANAGGKGVRIAVDTRRNAVVVTGPQDKIGLAKKLIDDLDKPRNPQDKGFKPAEPVLKTYSVPPGSATELAKAIQAKMPWLQCITLQKQDQIMVLATPEDHLSVVNLLQVGDEGAKPAPKEK